MSRSLYLETVYGEEYWEAVMQRGLNPVGWTAVKDCAPKKNGEQYLVVADYGKLGKRVECRMFWNGYFGEPLISLNFPVSHWMPLPEFPTSQSQPSVKEKL